MKNYILFFVFVLFLSPAIAQEFGLAAYYADKYHGTPTAYGETYDKNKMTAAHKRHPLGTMLRVTRLDNNKSVVVRVNDKGPYLPGRIVDLSMAAARTLDLVKDGVAQVKVEVIESKPTQSRGGAAPVTASSSPKPETTSSGQEADQPKVNVSPVKQNKKLQDITPYGLYKVSIHKESTAGFGVQVASMVDYPNALRTVAQLEASFFDNVLVSVERSETGAVYKVILGPFPTLEKAQAYNDSLKKRYNRNGFVVNFSEFDY